MIVLMIAYEVQAFKWSWFCCKNDELRIPISDNGTNPHSILSPRRSETSMSIPKTI